MDNLLSGRTVLVVEDEMMVLMMIEDMLADLGCESVTSSATVANSVALIDGQHFDFALLDMNLGGVDSRPVAEALAMRGVPFVYSTGNTPRHPTDAMRERGVLKKPFTFEQLVTILVSELPDQSEKMVQVY